jgi:hypothetical protein
MQYYPVKILFAKVCPSVSDGSVTDSQYMPIGNKSMCLDLSKEIRPKGIPSKAPPGKGKWFHYFGEL